MTRTADESETAMIARRIGDAHGDLERDVAIEIEVARAKAQPPCRPRRAARRCDRARATAPPRAATLPSRGEPPGLDAAPLAAAFDFVTHPNRRDHYDGADYYREQMEQEERLAGLR